jgi:hypothetical protein
MNHKIPFWISLLIILITSLLIIGGVWYFSSHNAVSQNGNVNVIIGGSWYYAYGRPQNVSSDGDRTATTTTIKQLSNNKDIQHSSWISGSQSPVTWQIGNSTVSLEAVFFDQQYPDHTLSIYTRSTCPVTASGVGIRIINDEFGDTTTPMEPSIGRNFVGCYDQPTYPNTVVFNNIEYDLNSSGSSVDQILIGVFDADNQMKTFFTIGLLPATSTIQIEPAPTAG